MKYCPTYLSLVLLCSCSFSGKDTIDEKLPPNLLIVFPDEMRYQTMGFVGEEPVYTPNLDRFSGEALVLTQAASNYPLCSPFRGMLMTGKYPTKNNVNSNCNSQRPENELSKDDTCWSDVLKSEGYNLGYIGKWHLDAPYEPYVNTYNNSPERKEKWNEWCSPDRRHGFDFWYAYGTYDRHLNPMYWSTHEARDSFHYVNKWGPEHEADMAIGYIQNKKGKHRDNNKPFALVVSMNPPHSPYDQVPDKYLKLYEKLNIDSLAERPNLKSEDAKSVNFFKKNIRSYYAMVSGVDEQFGRILKALEEKGLEENTIVLFMSDHGCCLGIHGEVSKNNPYEESMRIPFLIRWPGKIKPGQDDLLISVPDYYPTLLSLMGYSDLIPASVQGKNYASVLQGKIGERPQSQLYMKMIYKFPELGSRGLRTKQFTLSLDISEKGIENLKLFDNLTDKYQLENLAHSNLTELENMKTEMILKMKSIDDPALKYFRQYPSD